MTEISAVSVGDAKVISLPRRVDFTNTQTLVDAVRAERDPIIVLDLSKTEAIDSTALGAVVQMLKQLRSEQRELRLASPTDAVRRVLAITRLDRVFDVYDTAEEATRSEGAAS